MQIAEEFLNPRAGRVTISGDVLHFSGGVMDDIMVYQIRIFLLMHRLDVERKPPYVYWYSTNGFKYVVYPGSSAHECFINSDGMVMHQL